MDISHDWTHWGQKKGTEDRQQPPSPPDPKAILHAHATKNKDGFLSGQVRWIVEAMEEYSAAVNADLIKEHERMWKLSLENLLGK